MRGKTSTLKELGLASRHDLWREIFHRFITCSSSRDFSSLIIAKPSKVLIEIFDFEKFNSSRQEISSK